MEEVTTEERLRRLEDVHGEVSLGDRLWAADNLRGLKAYADQIEKQNRMLKEQLGIWKRKAGENQLIAGRWQYLFETSQKCVNRIEDIFEYTWQKKKSDFYFLGFRRTRCNYHGMWITYR
jgi:hypothetical protein